MQDDMSMAQNTAAVLKTAQSAYRRKWSFLASFLFVFIVSFLVLQDLDLVPNPPKEAYADTGAATSADGSPLVAEPSSRSTLSADALDASVFGTHAAEAPVKIEIPTIGLSASVSNPETTNIEKLDEALLTGAVRYPTSALLGASGNVVLFGHSSYLPIVHNQAFKTFDGIQNLKAGDRITVSSATHAYVYAVDSVEKMNAADAAIPLSVTGEHLTLSTCDSFGTKSDRFVVSAHLVESHALAS